MASGKKYTVLLAGGTGLIGHELLAQWLASPDIGTIHALARRLPAGPAPPAKLHWHVVDFTALPALPPADAAVCALGTTIKVAGSQAAFRAVDFDAVVAFAHAAKTAGVKRFAVVSALGASATSPTFYNRVKAEMESALKGLNFESLVIARPSLLLGERGTLGQPARRGELIGAAIARPLGWLIPQAWRPIAAATVASAIRVALQQGRPGLRVVESKELQSLGTA
jgi:uncharacterized protein YbjT (DUF2867 family)